MSTADLRKRLNRVGIGRRTPNRSTASAEVVQDPTLEEPLSIEDVVSSQEIETPAGTYYQIESTVPLSDSHGPFELQEMLGVSPEVVAQLAYGGDTSNPDLSRLVFLDTETTGLAGGAGTLAFLVGVGFFDGNHFCVRQYFLRDPSEEVALVAALAKLLENCSGLVTFNGRTFDVPLLESRFLLARNHFDLRALLHLDLLPPARRLWRGRLENCRLGTLEIEVLGIERTAVDVPGWMIPEIYTTYLRTGDARELQRLIYHNEIDILSMVSLATYLVEAYADPLSEQRTGADCLRLAIWLDKIRELEHAERAYQASLERIGDDDQQALALKRYGALLKRNNRRDEAVPLWSRLAKLTPGDPDSFVEIAKYYEWHAHDLPLAIDWTQQALEQVSKWPPTWQRDDVDAALQHRLARLELKSSQTVA